MNTLKSSAKYQSKSRIKYVFFITILFCSTQFALAQSQEKEGGLEKQHTFQGAQADTLLYKAIYQLDTDDPKIIEKTIRNVNNVLEDPRLKNNLKIEIIAFSGGTQALLKENKQYKAPLEKLSRKGVIIAQCENSVEEQHRTKEEFFEFVSFVPSGNGELIIRAQQGWVIIKP